MNKLEGNNVLLVKLKTYESIELGFFQQRFGLPDGDSSPLRLARGAPLPLALALARLLEGLKQRRGSEHLGHASSLGLRAAFLRDVDLYRHIIESIRSIRFQLSLESLSLGTHIAQKTLHNELLNILPRLRFQVVLQPLLGHVDGDIEQVANDLVHVFPVEANLRKLGRLHLNKRCLRQFGDPSSDLRLAASSRSDHENVLRDDLILEVIRKLVPSPPIAQSYRHRLLRIVNVALKL